MNRFSDFLKGFLSPNNPSGQEELVETTISVQGDNLGSMPTLSETDYMNTPPSEQSITNSVQNKTAVEEPPLSRKFTVKSKVSTTEQNQPTENKVSKRKSEQKEKSKKAKFDKGKKKGKTPTKSTTTLVKTFPSEEIDTDSEQDEVLALSARLSHQQFFVSPPKEGILAPSISKKPIPLASPPIKVCGESTKRGLERNSKEIKAKSVLRVTKRKTSLKTNKEPKVNRVRGKKYVDPLYDVEIIDGQENYPVIAVVGFRLSVELQDEYFVVWDRKGTRPLILDAVDEEDLTWESYRNLEGSCDHLVNFFNKRRTLNPDDIYVETLEEFWKPIERGGAGARGRQVCLPPNDISDDISFKILNSFQRSLPEPSNVKNGIEVVLKVYKEFSEEGKVSFFGVMKCPHYDLEFFERFYNIWRDQGFLESSLSFYPKIVSRYFPKSQRKTYKVAKPSSAGKEIRTDFKGYKKILGVIHLHSDKFKGVNCVKHLVVFIACNETKQVWFYEPNRVDRRDRPTVYSRFLEYFNGVKAYEGFGVMNGGYIRILPSHIVCYVWPHLIWL